jgi:4-hydroxy-tetrahydrodipicolinate synthase
MIKNSIPGVSVNADWGCGDDCMGSEKNAIHYRRSGNLVLGLAPKPGSILGSSGPPQPHANDGVALPALPSRELRDRLTMTRHRSSQNIAWISPMTQTKDHTDARGKLLPTGSIPALITPMREDGHIDWACYRKLIDWHAASGTSAIVVMGSTGEAATVSMDEHRELISVAVEHAQGKMPIIAGAGANSTSEAIELARFAQKAGATAALSVVPYYNKPTQEGLFVHFKAIAEAVDIPLILYNVPGRTIVDLANETVLRLAQIPNVVGLKDATGDIARGISLMRSLPEGFALYSGDDPTAASLMLLGACGNISVTANVIPAIMARLCAAARAGDAKTVRDISLRIAPLHSAMFVESNPIPVKWALAQLDMALPFYRPPLTPLSPVHHAQVWSALQLALDGDFSLPSNEEDLRS